MLIAALLGACSESNQPEAGQQRNSVATKPAQGCSAGLVVMIDRESFASRGGNPPFSSRQLDDLAKSAAGKFKYVVDGMCNNGRIDAARISGFRTLLIQSASGATETLVYEDQTRFPGALILQWTFVEEDLRLPDLTDITDGLTCWADLTASMCADRMP